MPNLTKVLQDEIRRLARKETRLQISATKQAVAKQRREITALKKQLQQQQSQIASLRSQAGRPVVVPELSAKSIQGFRFSPSAVRSHRKKIKLSAEEYARLIGVSMQTVYHWEQGKSRPRKSQLAALIAVRSLGRREALRRLEMLLAGPATDEE